MMGAHHLTHCVCSYINYDISSLLIQVVAGLNYKLTIALMKDSICLGALKVTVYDHFGQLSVTKWGDQLTCYDVRESLNEVQVDDEEETAIEAEERIEEEVEAAEPNE